MNSRGLRALAVVAACGISGIMGVGPSASAGQYRPSYLTRCGLLNVTTGARTCTYTFVHTREVETFVVPPSRGPIEITAVGAPGFGEDAVRSRGARVSGSYSFISGTPLFITVGGDGYYDGYNGGMDGGGGASDVRLGFPDLQHRVLVAGGGGGGGGLYGGGGGGGCLGGDEKDHLCLESQPGSGGGGSSLVPPGGTFALSDSLEPSVTITVTQYG